MTLTPYKPETTPKTAPSAIAETEAEFNWRNCWYPLTFSQDLPLDRPMGFSLYDEPLVLFRNQDSQLVCLRDRCPHRAAKLSDGQITDGKIECLYHGWQFGTEGECLHIPQLPADAKIPAKACVQSFKVVEKQGIIWMWAGDARSADENGIPTVADLDDRTVMSSDYMLDLPYDQAYFVENILDPAHLNISHEATINSRKDAQPLEMEVLKVSAQGIRGRYRTTKQPDRPWIDLNFIAPNLATYRSSGASKTGRLGGAALYSLPLGKGRCRILVRNYTNKPTWRLKWQPRWMEHWYRDKFLEEDLALVVGQEEQIERLGDSLSDLYLPLKTSDLLAIEYRKWLDKFGSSLPFYQGYSTVKIRSEQVEENEQYPALDRLNRHTLICGSCSQAYRTTKRVKQILIGCAIAFAALAILAEDSSTLQIVAVVASLFSVGFAGIAHQVKTKFEQAYTRH